MAGIQGEVTAHASLQTHFTDGLSAGCKQVYKAVTIALCLNTDNVEAAGRWLVFETDGQNLAVLRARDDSILKAKGQVCPTGFIGQHHVEIGVNEAIFGRDNPEPIG